MDQMLTALLITAKPNDIPSGLTIDISGLEIGHALRVSDIPLPPGVTTSVDPEESGRRRSARRVRGRPHPRGRRGRAAEGEEGEGAEGEGGEARGPGDGAGGDGGGGDEGGSGGDEG